MKKAIPFLIFLLTMVSCSQKQEFVHEGYTNGLDDPQTITFFAEKGQYLSAKLVSPDTANLRINQIITPSEQGDGPFGKELNYTIDETGDWKMVVGGSLMQGDNYRGEFTLTWILE